MGVAFLDRLLGHPVEAPAGLSILGRYVFVAGEHAALIAGQRARPGEYVAARAGGWTVWLEAEARRLTGEFSRDRLPGDATVHSIVEIGRRIETLQAEDAPLERWLSVSPLLTDAGNQLASHPLEDAAVVELGYLRAVCHAPSARLRHIHELVPVSRARRITPKTIARLSAHSEDWAQLRPDGVRPERVLAPAREPSLDLYENRVAARLVEHLWQHVRRRISEVHDIDDFVGRIDELQQEVRERPRRARSYLYGMLADLTARDTWQELTLQRLEKLDELRSAVAILLDSRARRGVRRQTEVGTWLRTTNLLTHDERYRGVANLWRAWASSEQRIESAAEDFGWGQNWCRAFEGYTALLVVRALDLLGIRAPADLAAPKRGGPTVQYPDPRHRVALQWGEDGVLTLSRDGEPDVRIVPMPHALTAARDPAVIHAALNLVATDDADLIVVYPGSRDERRDLPTALRLRVHSGAAAPPPDRGERPGPFTVPVSPLDIDSVVRVARAVRWALEHRRLTHYPAQVACPPPEATSLAAGAAWLTVDAGGLLLTAPPTDQELTAARSRLAQMRTEPAKHRQRGGNGPRITALSKELEAASNQLRQLTTCPACGQVAVKPERTFEPRADGTYRCACACGSAWEVRRCQTCTRSYPVLTLASGRSPSGNADDAGQTLGGDGDHLDRAFAADLLAGPCWIRSRAYLCPHCGTCPQKAAQRAAGCTRCESAQ